MKLIRFILFAFLFLLFTIITTTTALFLPNQLWNNTGDDIKATVHLIIGSNTFNLNESVDDSSPYDINISRFTSDFIFTEIGPARLFKIYQNDKECLLLRSQFLGCKKCTVLLNNLSFFYFLRIINELKKWKNNLIECQKNNTHNLCRTPDNHILINMINIRKYMMSVGYVCRCDNNKTTDFCKEVINLNKLANHDFIDIIRILQYKELNLNEYISVDFHAQMIHLRNEPNNTFYGCSQNNDQINNQILSNEENQTATSTLQTLISNTTRNDCCG